ncbi:MULTISPECIES: acyltransferase [unclassified Curtobacterium]|uniref:acyltransferase family protein n=1 Tax=unclassified Curtobacterium TaxID=257496 RepID=UPI0008DCA701|nr:MULTISPECIES: acyltransferase [unclassified Curtobacterium]OIH95740.1 hypothetical protein BIU92_04365 [Curtobacterium sp. MCBA15_003]OII31309.1 hypothetical protein BIU94_04920 [Curtobacterium sp. MMLR14_006]
MPQTSDVTLPDASVRAGRVEFLDAIRGVAAAAVVLEHALEAWMPEYTRYALQYLSVGRVGVVAFFLVSGYVVGMMLSTQDVRVFAVRRFWRLFPVYWLVLGVAILVQLPTHPATDDGILVLVANLLMVQGIVALPSVLGSAWTLGPELLYYVQSGLGKHLGHLDRTVYAGYAWLALYAAMSVTGYAIGKELPATTPLMLFLASFGHSIHLRERRGSRVWIGYACATLVVVPLCSAPLIASQQDPAHGYGLIGFNLSVWVGVLLFTVFSLRRSSRSVPSMLWLGAVSYALYLLHLPVIDGVRSVVPSPWAGVPVAVTLSVTAAWVVHRWFETPFIELGRRFSRGRGPVPSQSGRRPS